MLPAEEFERLTGRAKKPQSLAKFFAQSPQGDNRSGKDAGLRRSPGLRPRSRSGSMPLMKTTLLA